VAPVEGGFDKVSHHNHGLVHNHHCTAVAEEEDKENHHHIGREVVGRVNYPHSHLHTENAAAEEEEGCRKRVEEEGLDNLCFVGLPRRWYECYDQ
jgi:hypothetical protein